MTTRDTPRSGEQQYEPNQQMKNMSTSFISEFTLGTAMSRRSRMALTDPASGRELPVEVVSGKVKNEHGEPIAIVSVLHDLTKQVENERLYEALKRFTASSSSAFARRPPTSRSRTLELQWQSQEVERAND